MTAQGGGQRRSATLLFVGVVVLACMVSAIAYVFLVVTERSKAEKFKHQVETMHQQVELATGYLKRHSASATLTKQNVDDDSQELKRRIPFGPVNLTVGSYIDTAAAAANIIDIKWSVEGGLKVPKSQLDDARTPQQRLLVNPTTLKRSVIDVEFHSRYKEFLQLMKALAEAPWMVEVTNVSFRREVGPKLLVKLEMRYIFE